MNERNFKYNDIIKHFKRELCNPEELEADKYLYRFICETQHTETGEKTVVYQALYGDFAVYNRPVDMFYSEVDREKYPDVKQQYRLELVDIEQELTQMDAVALTAVAISVLRGNPSSF